MSLEHHLTDLLAMFSFAQNEILYAREREGPPGIELIFVRIPCVSVVSDTSCDTVSLSHQYCKSLLNTYGHLTM